MKSCEDIIEEVKDEICNRYCRFLYELNAKDHGSWEAQEDAYQEMLSEQCNKCPLNRL